MDVDEGVQRALKAVRSRGLGDEDGFNALKLTEIVEVSVSAVLSDDGTAESDDCPRCEELESEVEEARKEQSELVDKVAWLERRRDDILSCAEHIRDSAEEEFEG